MLKQRDLPEPIKSQGCFFMSCIYPAQKITGYTFSHKEVDFLWLEVIAKGYIIESSWTDNKGHQRTAYKVRTSAKIMNLAMREAGSNREFHEIGTFSGGKFNWYALGNNPEYRKPNAFLIQKVKVDNDEGGEHFRVVDRFGNVIYDPETLKYKMRSIVYSICYYLEAVK